MTYLGSRLKRATVFLFGPIGNNWVVPFPGSDATIVRNSQYLLQLPNNHVRAPAEEDSKAGAGKKKKSGASTSDAPPPVTTATATPTDPFPVQYAAYAVAGGLANVIGLFFFVLIVALCSWSEAGRNFARKVRLSFFETYVEVRHNRMLTG